MNRRDRIIEEVKFWLLLAVIVGIAAGTVVLAGLMLSEL